MTPQSSSFKTLRLDRVGRAFGTLAALRDLSLSVERGEFIALLGPSGCGKSTALNCIAGLLPTSEGSIWLDERRIDTLRPEERGFGMVFQNYALFPHMSVRDNIGFGLRMRGLARRGLPNASTPRWRLSASRPRPANCRASSPADSSSASPLRAPSSSSRRLF